MPKAKDTNTNEWFTFESYSADDLCNTLAQSLDKLEMLGCNDTQVKSDIESAIATISTNDCELIVIARRKNYQNWQKMVKYHMQTGLPVRECKSMFGIQG